VHAVGVALTGSEARDVHVPHVVLALDERDARRLAPPIVVGEETELDRRRVLGEEREVDARAVAGGAQGSGRARPHLHGLSISDA
jgi:hypothetical protein